MHMAKETTILNPFQQIINELSEIRHELHELKKIQDRDRIPKLLTVREFADAIKSSESHVRNRYRAGKIKFIKQGKKILIPDSELYKSPEPGKGGKS